MKRWGRIALMTLLPLGILAASQAGCNMGQYEEPAYSALQKEDAIELREYAPKLVAEVTVKGERQPAISQGFRMIADFIFGNNTTQTAVAMTAPVTQQASETIAMTTPVTQQQGKAGSWRVQFVMPSEYTKETLPKPRNPEVKIREEKARTMAVIRFSGSSKDEALLAEKTEQLQAYVKTHGLKPLAAPVLAFYDPPWTLPFLRRNEVMIEVAPLKKR